VPAIVNVLLGLFGIERAGRFWSRIPERWLAYLRDHVYEAAVGAAIGVFYIRTIHYLKANPDANPLPFPIDWLPHFFAGLPLPL